MIEGKDRAEQAWPAMKIYQRGNQMTTYDNTNRGILSRNDRKEKDTHPSHKGSINIEGVEYWLDAWTQERKDGSGKFFNLSVKRKDQQAAPARAPAPAPKPAPKSGFDDMSDDVPF